MNNRLLTRVLTTAIKSFLLLGCTTNTQNSDVKDYSDYNFLFITCEDISPSLSFYGDSTAKTPNLDRLAESSLIFDNAFTTVGVCSPSRSSIATGMYPISIGTHNMRTAKDVWGFGKRIYMDAGLKDYEGNSVIEYSTVLPDSVKVFTQFLREHNYFTTNNYKTDMQFAVPLSAFDENSKTAHYKNRKPGQAFFAIFNSLTTHESKIWMHANDSMRVNPDSVFLPSFFPDNEIVRNDVARNYSNIEVYDKEVGRLLDELEANNLLDSTIIFFFSDHGGPLPRGKRLIYDSGLKVPFMIRFPYGANKGRTDQLVSFVDIAPTVLSLAGIKPPEYMQGVSFAGKYVDEEREFIYASRDRFDELYDRVRAIRNKEYLLVKNYHTKTSRYLDVQYRKQIPMMMNLLELRDSGKLNKQQMHWFEYPIPEYELYDVNADPDQLNNISQLPEYAEIVAGMSAQLEKWLQEVGDKGGIPEGELLQQMWPNLEQPVTEKPIVTKENEGFIANCLTPGSDIVYRIESTADTISGMENWKLLTEAVEAKAGEFIHFKAVRIGYADSEASIVAIY